MKREKNQIKEITFKIKFYKHKICSHKSKSNEWNVIPNRFQLDTEKNNSTKKCAFRKKRKKTSSERVKRRGRGQQQNRIIKRAPQILNWKSSQTTTTTKIAFPGCKSHTSSIYPTIFSPPSLCFVPSQTSRNEIKLFSPLLIAFFFAAALYYTLYDDVHHFAAGSFISFVVASSTRLPPISPLLIVWLLCMSETRKYEEYENSEFFPFSRFLLHSTLGLRISSDNFKWKM